MASTSKELTLILEFSTNALVVEFNNATSTLPATPTFKEAARPATTEEIPCFERAFTSRLLATEPSLIPLTFEVIVLTTLLASAERPMPAVPPKLTFPIKPAVFV